ncbi:MAG: hypothetical protein IKT56_02720 [Clostridia bacterium]|nr:hypothetical protein [Clostridia bacterium]
MNKVQKLLSVGDTVFSAQGGQKMKVLSMNDVGFETEEDFFPYDEVRKTYFLTRYGYERRRLNEQREAD